MRRALWGLMGIALLAGCGSTVRAAPPPTPATAPVGAPASTIPGPPTTVSRSTLQADYLAALAPANAALTTANDAIGKLPANPLASDLGPIFAPVVTAYMKAETALRAIPWPATDVDDAHALIQAIAAYAGVLGTAGDQTAFSYASFETQANAAVQAGQAAANTLRADIGLPPASAKA